MAEKEQKRRRKGNRPWKHIYGTDRKYTARVDRLKERLHGASGRTSGATSQQ